MEFKQRDKPTPDFEFFELDGYHVVCTADEMGERVYILLNPRYAPFYKQLPKTDYSLTQEDFLSVLKQGRLISTVEEVMQSRIQKK